MKTPLTIGVVGLAGDGRRLVSAFNALPQADVRWLCDAMPELRLKLRHSTRNARATSDIDDLLADDSLDALVVTSPIESRYRLAVRALEADKHLLVRTPIAPTAVLVGDLVRRAERSSRLLMAADLVPFHPGIRSLKELIQRGSLGDVYYLHVHQQAPRKSSASEDALWDFLADDLSAVLHLLDDEPIELLARGDSFLQSEALDVVFCHVRFATGIVVHLQASYLDPHRLHRFVIVGSRRTAAFDLIQPQRMLAVYENQTAAPDEGRFDDGEEIDFGSLVVPKLPWRDPAELVCQAFVSSVSAPGMQGAEAQRPPLALVSALEALQQSLADDHVLVGKDYEWDNDVTDLSDAREKWHGAH